MYRSLAALFACTTVVLACAVAWFAVPLLLQTKGQRSDEDIVFPTKTFVAAKAWVAAKGTLVGDWITYKNNTYSILCVPDECIVANLQQTGPSQISSIDGPVVYPMKRWTDDEEVVAEDATLCVRITITLDRRTKTVFWVETPINQSEFSSCKNADANIRKATLETSLYWQQASRSK
jgi:hypothetical protein